LSEPAALSEDDRREVLWRTYQSVQREQHEAGALAEFDRTLLTRLGAVLAFLGAVQLGILMSSVGMLMVYVVTRLILHLDFSRYFGA
jgi:hypothetical protein